jgi:nucleotide-binding universal stress UspA family protein
MRTVQPSQRKHRKGRSAVIVVGVDDSEHSQTVLRFAIDEARLHDLPLRVICAWGLPTQKWAEIPPPEGSVGRPRHRAEEIVAEAAQIAKRLAPNVQCEPMALEGEAGSLLVQQSSDATMVVVGRYGRGMVGKMFGAAADVAFGSVSQRVIRDARCPVIVVPLSSSDK